MKIVQFLRPSTLSAHLLPKSFHPLELGRPISNETQSPNDTVLVNKRNQNKKKQVTQHSNWPRVLLLDVAHKQCNGIIKG